MIVKPVCNGATNRKSGSVELGSYGVEDIMPIFSWPASMLHLSKKSSKLSCQ